ncbi:hypothetical protein G6F68_018330 [Rhizopus microsporus]|nr:hypothetical protein G6F32_016783 [Rhizopus arrhizus]KAG1239748.1 hypothetical protein G6F68_018330 [Rhizopus microsporus]
MRQIELEIDQSHRRSRLHQCPSIVSSTFRQTELPTKIAEHIDARALSMPAFAGQILQSNWRQLHFPVWRPDKPRVLAGLQRSSMHGVQADRSGQQ